jgi:hypothetical protein
VARLVGIALEFDVGDGCADRACNGLSPAFIAAITE